MPFVDPAILASTPAEAEAPAPASAPAPAPARAPEPSEYDITKGLKEFERLRKKEKPTGSAGGGEAAPDEAVLADPASEEKPDVKPVYDKSAGFFDQTATSDRMYSQHKGSRTSGR